MPSKPRLNRAQVAGLKRRLALRDRLSMTALQRRYGIGRKAIWEYATGQTPPIEDWKATRARPGPQGIYGFSRRTNNTYKADVVKRDLGHTKASLT